MVKYHVINLENRVMASVIIPILSCKERDIDRLTSVHRTPESCILKQKIMLPASYILVHQARDAFSDVMESTWRYRNH